MTEQDLPAERWRTLEQLDDWLRLPMQVLSLAWLAIVVAELVHGVDPLLSRIGVGLWGLFIAEFLLRFTLAPAKQTFLRRNWLTAIALLLPALRLVRGLSILRAGRALRGLRLVRIVGTANRGMNTLRATLRRRQFGFVSGLTLLVIGLGAAGMLSFEPAREVAGGFTSYGDALWWTAMLVSSVGSEFWPKTTEGRILASLLTVYGLAVFGYITAAFASVFIGRDAADREARHDDGLEREALRREIAALRAELARQASQAAGGPR
jgi:voltage-gated potassium channel